MKSATLVDSIAKALPSRFTRRGFFARTAVVGSALAANPLDFALRPNSAYAAVCNCRGSNCDCGALCCDGYTEFCCTLNGQNKCPPGSILAGWWKADGTGFCGGPRYYMDCNAPCNGCGCGGGGLCSGACSGTSCGCAGGDCNNRGAGCTLFRYGQCHGEVPCLGPIVCRVVTCVPPWAIDATCTTVTRVDDGTAGHNRACLHAVVGAMDLAQEVGGGIRVVGWAIDFDTQDPVTVHCYVGGQFAGAGVANAYRPDVSPSYPGYGPNHGYDFVVPVANNGAQVCVIALNAAYPGDNTLLGCATPAAHSPFGSLDSATVNPTTVTVTGWAFDPDAPTATIQVAIGIDGTEVGRGNANQYRPDLVAFYPGAGPNHGFSINVPTFTGAHDVCAVALNIGEGGNRVLGCRHYEIGRPFGNIDSVTPGFPGVRFEGWVIDPDTTGPVTIGLRVDGQVMAAGTANLSRPDVGAVFPGYGNNHGFAIEAPAGPGVHNVCLVATDVGPNVERTVACRTVNVLAGRPFGAVDNIMGVPGGIRAMGWVIDPDTASPTSVHVYVDGRFAVQAVADDPRPDVERVWGGYGTTHGFDIPVLVPGGVHQICVFGIDTTDQNNNVLMQCRDVVVPSGPPFGALDAAIPQAGGIRVLGWMIDPDTSGPATVHIYVNGAYAAQAVAQASRPDVGNRYPNYGSNHGFDFVVPTLPGTHEVCLFGINVGIGQNQLVACRGGVVVP